VAVVVALAGGGVWWDRAVTAEPGLSLDGRPNVVGGAGFGDRTGMRLVENSFGTDVDVDYQAGGQLHAYFGLYNHGSRTIRIEAVPPQGFYYWAFDGAAVSRNWRTAVTGQDYIPFRPFSLRPGQTRYVRLDFHQATCDPAGLQDGYSRIRPLPVTYRILGVTRTTTVPFDQVAIAIQTIGICEHALR
jgi:hypothetical protein